MNASVAINFVDLIMINGRPKRKLNETSSSMPIIVRIIKYSRERESRKRKPGMKSANGKKNWLIKKKKKKNSKLVDYGIA